VDPDDSVLFLDCPKHEIFFGGQSSPSAPSYGVSLEGIVEILSVQFVKNRPEIEVFALVKKLKLPLEWEPFDREFPLSLSHKKKCLKSREQIRAGNRQKEGSLKSSRTQDWICAELARFSAIRRNCNGHTPLPKRHLVSYWQPSYGGVRQLRRVSIDLPRAVIRYEFPI
jgi:hypothetical protein